MSLPRGINRSLATLALTMGVLQLIGADLLAQQAGPLLGVVTQPNRVRVMGDPGRGNPTPRWVIRGVKVTQVVPGSPAARNKIKVGTVILAANKKKLSSHDGLRQIVATSNGQLKLKIEDMDEDDGYRMITIDL